MIRVRNRSFWWKIFVAACWIIVIYGVRSEECRRNEKSNCGVRQGSRHYYCSHYCVLSTLGDCGYCAYGECKCHTLQTKPEKFTNETLLQCGTHPRIPACDTSAAFDYSKVNKSAYPIPLPETKNDSLTQLPPNKTQISFPKRPPKIIDYYPSDMDQFAMRPGSSQAQNFFCSSSDSSSNITWLHIPRNSTKSRVVKFSQNVTTSGITLQNTSVTDDGWYRCLVSNEAGEALRDWDVWMIYPDFGVELQVLEFVNSGGVTYDDWYCDGPANRMCDTMISMSVELDEKTILNVTTPKQASTQQILKPFTINTIHWRKKIAPLEAFQYTFKNVLPGDNFTVYVKIEDYDPASAHDLINDYKCFLPVRDLNSVYPSVPTVCGNTFEIIDPEGNPRIEAYCKSSLDETITHRFVLQVKYHLGDLNGEVCRKFFKHIESLSNSL